MQISNDNIKAGPADEVVEDPIAKDVRDNFRQLDGVREGVQSVLDKHHGPGLKVVAYSLLSMGPNPEDQIAIFSPGGKEGALVALGRLKEAVNNLQANINTGAFDEGN